MTAPAFKQVIRPGNTGLDVAAVKRALRKAGYGRRIKLGRKMGAGAVIELKKFQAAKGLVADGKYGEKTHKKLLPYFSAYARQLYRRAKLRRPPLQTPRLPKVSLHPFTHERPASDYYGLQPWIVPQVKYLCKRFNLRVTAGWASSGHAGRSDHYWAGAVDLAGSYEDMVACTLYLDRMRNLGVLRWVGGPAHDADGVEHGHGDHVHASWHRFKATSIFRAIT